MTKYIKYIFLISITGIVACDDQIFPKLTDAPIALVVDAWITNHPREQVIYLTRSQSYFDNSTPLPAIGAEVMVIDNNGNNFAFVDNDSKGAYIWTPPTGQIFGTIGDDYSLKINFEGETFISQSMMNPVPLVDSVTFSFEEKNAFNPDSFYGEFWSRDLLGPGDTYWIKAFKNGQLLGKPSELNLAYDAAFSKGGDSDSDNKIFIPPIRGNVNPSNDEDDDNLTSPYIDGDSLYVEIHSINESAFNFLTQVVIQTDRPGGFGELFAKPLSNVSTNISNQNVNSETIVLGFFNVAAVSGNGKKLIESEVERE
jgi:hypothetical protein